jgi:hypothetical protein
MDEETVSLGRPVSSIYDMDDYESRFIEEEDDLGQRRYSFDDQNLADIQPRESVQQSKKQIHHDMFEPVLLELPQYLSRPPSKWPSTRPPSYSSNPRESTEKLDLSYPFRPIIHDTLDPSRFRQNVPSMKWRLLIATPAFISALTWGGMLIYFQVWFLKRPRLETGAFARIGITYGGYPFISCIGARRMTTFQTCAIIVACCIWWIFAWDFWIGIRARRFASFKGNAWFYILARSLKFFAAICGGAFLIGLTFASVENGNQHHTHLILTTIHVIGMGGTRFWDFFVTREIVKRIRANGERRPKTMSMNKTAKNLEGAICLVGACVLFPAVYGCSSEHVVVSTSPLEVKLSDHCFALLSYAAIFEWIMSIAWYVDSFLPQYLR